VIGSLLTHFRFCLGSLLFIVGSLLFVVGNRTFGSADTASDSVLRILCFGLGRNIGHYRHWGYQTWIGASDIGELGTGHRQTLGRDRVRGWRRRRRRLSAYPRASQRQTRHSWAWRRRRRQQRARATSAGSRWRRGELRAALGGAWRGRSPRRGVPRKAPPPRPRLLAAAAAAGSGATAPHTLAGSGAGGTRDGSPPRCGGGARRRRCGGWTPCGGAWRSRRG